MIHDSMKKIVSLIICTTYPGMYYYLVRTLKIMVLVG